MLRSQIAGCGAYLPKRVLTNAELAKTVDTSDQWIVERTGIRQRHIAAPGERTSDLAIMASRAAIESAVCSGFVYGLAVADNFIRAGQAGTVLLIGAETFSRILDWEDRATCVLFGDGAGAVVLRAVEMNGDNGDRCVLSTHLHSDGRQRHLLFVDGGPSSTQTVGHLRMSGRDVFRSAVGLLAAAADEALEANAMSPDDIDWLVPHQANKRIMDATLRKLGLPAEKMICTIERHANTSAASIPLALAEASGDGRIKPGQIVLIEGMGGGFTWGSAMIRW